MTRLTRRGALLGATAMTALAACGQQTQSPEGAPAGAGTPAPSAPVRMDATAMAAAIAAGDTTSMEQVAAAIARAGSVNADINAIATETFEQARADALLPLTGAFAGVPTFIKDLLDWQGTQTLWGSRAFRGNIAAADSPFAQRWRAAGVVSLGKSTSPEMGLTSSTEPLVTGATRNPWDLSRIPGGSSGGAAALVAARVVPFAHASDGGGSIRIPASTCGVFGLKPSRGQLPSREPGAPPPVDISVNHAVTISVRDSINLFRLAQVNDGTFAPLGNLTPLTRRLRIGYAPESVSGTPVAPETRAALDEVAQLCLDLGHEPAVAGQPLAFASGQIQGWVP